MRLVLSRLYVILDAALLTHPETETAASLAGAGVRLLQYRNKQTSARELLEKSRTLAEELLPRRVHFIVNDRADGAVLAGASGVHVGQDDLGVEAARSIVGASSIVGVSTHNLEQFSAAAATSADYIALGPIFATNSKANPDPVVGVEMIRAARRLTEKPIVAIGGITLQRAAEVVAAGADSVAVISDILRARDPAKRAHEFLELLEGANHAAAV
jgi:thiamine-phosphate pyrophosphorylase